MSIKINPKEIHKKSSTIKPTEIKENRISFNLFNLKEKGDFCYIEDHNCLKTIITRLQALSEFSLKRLNTDQRLKKSLHYHRIDFNNGSVSEKTFGLSIKGADDNAYQFSLTVNTGRIHGFWEGDIFHIVWIDPAHKLYG